LKRDFTKLLDISADEARCLIERSGFLKRARRDGVEHKPLRDKSLAMIFEKASTRTRVSFEVGMRELGGYGVFLSPAETQMGRGEAIKDTARVLSRYMDAVMIRTFSQDTVEELATWASVPVINALSDLFHPCQILADLFTIQEQKGSLGPLKVAYVGDGNNVANSWIEASILFGLHLAVATPPHYEPDRGLVNRARENPEFELTNDPRQAVQDSDVVYTDVWASMGREEEKEARRKAFASYQVNEKLLKGAKADAMVLHCLPAYRNEEISEGVFERFQEAIFTQAENRLHAQKALLEWLIIGQT
jgi:ornithine carbamoyltransferase